MTVAAAAVRGFAWLAIGYFVVLNSGYLVLLALASGSMARDSRRGRPAGLSEIFASPLAPPISLVVPVRNQAGVIAGSTRGLLGLRYPEFEVIVVDDGSTDATFAAAGPGFAALLTILAVTTEELGYHRYHSWRDFALLVYGAVAESAGFRQAHAWWRLRGLAGAVLRHGAHRAGQPGARAHGEPALGAPMGERHVRVR